MTELITLGPLTLTRYGVGCALALLAVFAGMSVWCRVFSLRYAFQVRFAVLAVPLCWAFARLGFLVGNIGYYLRSLNSLNPMLYFWDGGYSMLGALGGMVIAARLAERWCHLPRYILHDAMALGLPLGIAVERCFEAGTGLGLGRVIETSLFLPLAAVNDLGDQVHPVWLYEVIAAGLILIALLAWMTSRRWCCPVAGDLLLIFLVLYGCSQVVMESLRADDHLVIHFVRIQQVGAAVLPVIAQSLWAARQRRKQGDRRIRIATWSLVIGGILGCIVLEFVFDSSLNLLRDYLLMVLCMALTAAGALWMRVSANRD